MFPLKHSYTSTRLDGVTYSHSRENLNIINALFFRYPYAAMQWTDIMNELDVGGLEFNFGIVCDLLFTSTCSRISTKTVR